MNSTMQKVIMAGMLGILASMSGGFTYAQDTPLKLTRTIPLESVDGRIDHLAIDAQMHRLYVAALGNNTIEVIDLDAGKRISQIGGLQEPQGIRVLPESGTIVVASGEDGKCRFYDKQQ